MTKEKKYIPFYYDVLFYKIYGDDKDTMFEQIKLKELNEALAKNTQDVTDKITEEVTNKVTKEVTSSTTRNIAVNMLNMNMNLEDISKVTGLSIDELNKIKKELN